MSKLATVFLSFLLQAQVIFAQHTFSIVAVDTITGEIGSAGATCLDDNTFPGSGGAIVISDVLPGRGAIHTQSYWLEQNQTNARAKMEEGLSPQEILDWLYANDAQAANNGADYRQYGVVDFDPDGHPRAAAFTGTYCLNYKNHRLGVNYAIQGNILKGKKVLDSMETRYLNTTGTLADRLMACLEGAATIVGADSRCTNNGTSSLSAFLRVAKPNDDDNNLYLDLNVPSLPAMTEPIDSLRTLYDNWKLTKTSSPIEKYEVKLHPNPANGQVILQFNGKSGRAEISNLSGQVVFQTEIFEGQNWLTPKLPPGVFMVKIVAEGRTVLTRKLIWRE